ncbi:uncharacterized acetyltransferase At3g50280-like isoform X2 [Euphorbia lathyris]|uniref:uncharacterized acetyltransferase At3g50280-like isoform X2 n=1 Tax=Euphorbia lathyris TaxID=212925 RepID=UPI0033141E40
MAEIRIVSTTLVKPPAEPILNRVELTSSDLTFLLLGSIQKGLLFPKPNSSSLTLIQHLKTSFSHTLQIIFPLAGRLSTTQHQDNTISFFIDCNNAGAQFVHAIAENVTVSDILDPIYVPSIVDSFFPLTDIYSIHGDSNPLLGVQITELSDGIFMGCTINHAVADGSTFWNFMNAWSEISRGYDVNQISKPPVFQNWFRDKCPIRLPLSIINNASVEFIPPPLKERVFHFSKEKIAGLKAKANSEAGDGNGVFLSSLQLVLAHIWRGVIRNRALKPDQETIIQLQIGFRKRLHLDMQDGYFGNAIQSERVQLKAREVIEKGIGFVALQLNKRINGYTDENVREKVREKVDSWIKDPKIRTMTEIASSRMLLVLEAMRNDSEFMDAFTV